METMQAEYKCLKCGYEYHGQTGPTQCPACGYEHVKWVNYEAMRNEWNAAKERGPKKA